MIKSSFLLLIGILCAQALAASPEQIAARIDELLAAPELQGGISGVLVESLADGRIVYEHNPDLLLIPASNMKIITSAAALDILGKNYRFETKLCAAGKLDCRGVLHGDLWLVGGGDPVLSQRDLEDFAKAVKEAGIKKVRGRIMADASRFDDVGLGPGWSWDDEPYYYSAQVSGLNFNENVAQVFVRPGYKPGIPAVVTLAPPTRYAQVSSACVTAASGAARSIQVSRLRGRNVITVAGAVAADDKRTEAEELIAVESPAAYAATVFRELLGRKCVVVTEGVGVGKAPSDVRLIATHRSAPLSEILALLNKPSDNLVAEVLLKELGVHAKGVGTWPNGAAAVMDFLEKQGVGDPRVAITDGSGLSRLNCVSPRVLVRTLRYMAGHPDADVFANSFPIAGVDGTLARRMKGTAAEGNVRAKTGYVTHVSALSGYLTAASGERFAFSIIMNNHLCSNRQATAVQDRICEVLAREL